MHGLCNRGSKILSRFRLHDHVKHKIYMYYICTGHKSFSTAIYNLFLSGTKLRGEASFWKSVCNTRMFVGEKFVGAATEEDHSVLTDMACMLLSQHFDKVSASPKYV